jgi:hypothetical protein
LEVRGTPTNDAVNSPIGADMLMLQQEMQTEISRYRIPGNYAVAVTDLQTGESVSVNGKVPHLSGCVINLFVLYQVALDVENGALSHEVVDALVAATTWSSNAETARELYRLTGNGDILEGLTLTNRLIQRVLGSSSEVVLDHPPAFVDESLGIDSNNWVSAEAMNAALSALWHGEVVGQALRDYLLDHLAAVKKGLNYLVAAVPEGTVSHKNGFFPDHAGYVDNDVGIVRLSHGNQEYAYAISFFAQEVPVKYGNVALGQQLSRLAYDTMFARFSDYPETDD